MPTTDPEPAPSVTVEDLNDTSWAGTDSEGTDTTFTFHTGGSTAVSFSGNEYDDPGDTWALDGNTLTITIYNVEGVGDATYVGEVTDPAGPDRSRPDVHRRHRDAHPQHHQGLTTAPPAADSAVAAFTLGGS